MKANIYKGFSLFFDVEDKALQAKNRASVIKNMVDDDDAKTAISYLELIPVEDRVSVIERILYHEENYE